MNSHGGQGGRTAWFGMLLTLYAVFVASFLFTSSLDDFWVVDWRIWQKVALFMAPLYILVLWHRREDLVTPDYHAAYLPAVAWFLVSLWRPKSLMNVVVVEPSMVVLLTGIHLGRFLVTDAVPSLDARRTAAAFLVVVVVLAVGIAWFVPFIGE